MFDPAGDWTDWELDEVWDDRDVGWEDPDRDFYNGQLWGHPDGEFLGGDYDPRFWPGPADDRVLLEAPPPEDLQRLRKKFPRCWETWGLGGLFDMGFKYDTHEIPLEDRRPSYRYCGKDIGAQWLAEWEGQSPVRAL